MKHETKHGVKHGPYIWNTDEWKDVEVIPHCIDMETFVGEF